jgi:CheY-like chemotaxis protein
MNDLKKVFRTKEIRVLVVDDMEMESRQLIHLLEKAGIKADKASSGQECLDMISKNEYMMIFIDQNMPVMSGEQTLKAFRGRAQGNNKFIPVIGLSSDVQGENYQSMINAGFTDVLKKPVKYPVMLALLILYFSKDLINRDEVDIARKEKPSEKTEEKLFIEKVSKTGSLDCESGIKYCGSEEGYISALKIFYTTITSKSGEIEQLYSSEDWSGYTIKVHALKSSARIIGAEELSELAKELEFAGKEEKTDVIREKTESLLKMYREYDGILSAVFEEDRAKVKEIITPEIMNDLYEKLKKYAMDIDYDQMEMIMNDLEKYDFPDEEKDRYMELKKYWDEVDYDAIVRIL